MSQNCNRLVEVTKAVAEAASLSLNQSSFCLLSVDCKCTSAALQPSLTVPQLSPTALHWVHISYSLPCSSLCTLLIHHMYSCDNTVPLILERKKIDLLIKLVQIQSKLLLIMDSHLGINKLINKSNVLFTAINPQESLFWNIINTENEYSVDPQSQKTSHFVLH